MGLFDRFSIGNAISTAVNSPVPDGARADAIKRLRSIGAAALPKMIAALPHDQFNVIGPLISEMLTNATVPVLVTNGLLSEDAEMATRAKRVLQAAKLVDPNRVFELYVGKGGSVINITDYLEQRRDAIRAKTMLRLLEFAREDNQPAVFSLIDRIANPGMISALIGFLKSAEWEGRYHIARTISRFPSEAVRDALARLLADTNKNVRQAALEGIATLRMPVPVAPVCALLRDPDMQVQAKAIDALIALNDATSVRYLLDILQDESEHVRRAAVEVLNAVGNANAIKDLLSALKDKDWWVRVRAADALGSIGGAKVIDAVLQFLGDEDEFMRRTAVEILNTTKDPRAFGYLVKALGDSDWWVRERAIDALANLGSKEAVPHLVALLNEDDQAVSVTIRALAQIGDPRAVTPILARLTTPDEAIQREAIEALGSLATPTQVPVVLEHLKLFCAINDDIKDVARRVATELSTKNTRSGARRSATATSMVSPLRVTPVGSPASAMSDASVDSDQTLVQTMEIDPEQAVPAKSMAVDIERQRPVATAIAVASDMPVIAPGEILVNRYKVIRELGKGGFGTVIQVLDQMVGEEIALKIINPNLVRDEGAINRFMHEVRYSRRITHENVIRVHDFLMIGGYYAISMEYFASAPLSRQIRNRLFQNQARCLKFARDIALGIQVAHVAGIMHRDLKPANLLVNEDDALKIVDFGLAAASSNTTSRVTKTGHLVGTPTYMSPEQARGLNVDARTDIYSLGVVMYEMFTGKVPYTGDNPMAVLFQHLAGEKESPRSRNAMITPAVEALILKAMAVDPNERFQTAPDLLCAIDALSVKAAA